MAAFRIQRWGAALVWLASCGGAINGAGLTGKGGSVGTGGNGAASGTGGGPVGGGAGATCQPISYNEATAACRASRCGNGVIDSCGSPGGSLVGTGGYGWGGQGGCGMSFGAAESCDGSNLGGMTCQGLGYLAGALGCSSDCTLDLSGCLECAPPSPPVVSCTSGLDPTVAQPADLGIAATETEVGLAWIDGGGPDFKVMFERRSPTLDLVSSVKIDALAITGFRPAIAVAPLPSGWVVVVSTRDSALFRLYAIDANGQLKRGTSVSTPQNGGAFYHFLAARPGAGPLLAWLDNGTLLTTVVAPDGLSTTGSNVVQLDGVPNSSTLGAGFVGDSFYVATTVSTPSHGVGQLRIVRIRPDTGVVVSVGQPFPPSNFVDVGPWFGVVDGATDLQLVYPKTDGTPLWQRFDQDGAAASAPVTIGGPNDWIIHQAVALGGETFFLVNRSAVGISSVTADGQIGRPFHQIKGPIGWNYLVRRGPDLIVAWAGMKGIGLARLTP